MNGFPPRLHVLLARAAPAGVVIRRGPSRQVCTILWDRRSDEFRVGQWLKGRIYERRSDLSPTGEYLIYFAMNGRWHGRAKGAWTAISRAPYLKAIGLYPKGDCWHGGGLFTGERTYWLNDGSGHEMLREAGEPRRDRQFAPAPAFGGECLGVYYPRLMRDGWRLVEESSTGRLSELTTFEKGLPGGWTLRKLAQAQLDHPPGRGCYWDEHALVHKASGRVEPCPDWEWAERDGGRLVWAAGGLLFAGEIGDDGLNSRRLLRDFRGMTFERIAAPY
jgi:hypothetical protein